MFEIVALSVFQVVLFGMLGASVSSFLSVVIERGKTGESINGRSHCACGRKLHWYENVPIIGWLRIGGVAKCCGAKLPVSYLMGEVLGFVIGAAAGVGYLILLGVF